MSTFNDYEKAVRSGRHEPYVHPDNAYHTKANQEEPKKWNKSYLKYLPYLFLILSLLLLFFSFYLLKTKQDPMSYIQDKAQDLKTIYLNSSDYKDDQRAALERLSAMERLASKALDDYYHAVRNGIPHPGLCITTGGRKTCHDPVKAIDFSLR